jgi:hypothetical protein
MVFTKDKLEKMSLWFSIAASFNSIIPITGFLYNRSDKKITRKL